MAAKYQDTALEPKYGGNVIEIDGKIVLATDDKMTEEIDDLVEQLEKNNPEESYPAGEGYISRFSYYTLGIN
ncbi:hypothetical protein FPSE_11098 [Fusarium pseudograminearum CS3096]|uniref:Uncharacterized protein n=1 Tax=Fusarium pseudograminearum (strain CS3096) TaxID=1028729 RepID=K3VXD9_FUSPC|nr:hypothetical protein FPSE_11098 [Fusarium pseudograminearum CS3096]EKJ68730.1 hypothetical protein FPSE_11098 [Fusarium pseudograminearum CS3096]